MELAAFLGDPCSDVSFEHHLAILDRETKYRGTNDGQVVPGIIALVVYLVLKYLIDLRHVAEKR